MTFDEFLCFDLINLKSFQAAICFFFVCWWAPTVFGEFSLACDVWDQTEHFLKSWLVCRQKIESFKRILAKGYKFFWFPNGVVFLIFAVEQNPIIFPENVRVFFLQHIESTLTTKWKRGCASIRNESCDIIVIVIFFFSCLSSKRLTCCIHFK